ncbi:ABC transporter substrate-binding protein [Sediminispirochaeta bajacaliforniensis]|uniref:ABC transporter substrate-binding protein n=1 Tax=Sediminispirochaeta bajacaliforniensis TaxID=148 RepID=UPI000370F3D6|nr:ABC transporter substrate-binding protein [Sediminispirochaeta bajacaliforniensis]
MRKNLPFMRWIIAAIFILGMVTGCAKETDSQKDADTGAGYPNGTMVLYDYGQPQYWLQFFTNYLVDHPEETEGVSVEMVQTEGEADVRQKVQMSLTAGSYGELPDAIATAPVSMQALAEGGALMDMTDFLTPYMDDFFPGTFDQITYKGKIYGLPKSLRPQLIFYNKDVFDTYGIDPAEMDTFAGYLEVGRKLKKLSNGTVYLSYIDPGSRTWRYYGRRGFMPQANARIWDDAGNIVIDKDPGARRAFETIRRLYEEGLLLKSKIFEPPLYEACRNGQIATFYIGAFWDEFLRKNLPDMKGSWRVMPAPVYSDIGTRGAAVIGIQAIVKKPKPVYAGLYEDIWLDFHFNGEARKKWTISMEEQNAPYPNPITEKLLEDPFWKEPSAFYGGQSFREMEGIGLRDASENMRVTSDDAEADLIISAELEKYLAGDQSMDEAVINMGKNLRAKIGKTEAK